VIKVLLAYRASKAPLVAKVLPASKDQSVARAQWVIKELQVVAQLVLQVFKDRRAILDQLALLVIKDHKDLPDQLDLQAPQVLLALKELLV